MKLWYKELGYRYNPFTIKPGFFDDEVFGYDKEIDTLVDSLCEPTMFFLEGEYGLGKTSTINYLINEFKGSRRVIHISRNRSDRAMNYSQLLKNSAKGLGKLFGKKPKNVLLIVDETEKINDDDCKQIQKLFDAGYFTSVLFVDKSFKDANLSKNIRTLIGKNVLKLSSLSTKDALELARGRLEGNKDFISDDIIKKVYEASNKNTRQFLLHLEEVSRNAFAHERKKVTKEDLKILD